MNQLGDPMLQVHRSAGHSIYVEWRQANIMETSPAYNQQLRLADHVKNNKEQSVSQWNFFCLQLDLHEIWHEGGP